MAHPDDPRRYETLRPVSALEPGRAQPDPALRSGPASGIYSVMTALAVMFILAVVFYGLNSQRPEGGVETAAAPTAGSSPAPTGTNPSAGETTGQGGAQTTGQGAPMRDGAGAGTSTGEASGGQPQQAPADAAKQQQPGQQGAGAEKEATPPGNAR